MSKITKSLLRQIFPATPTELTDRFVEPFNLILPKYGVINKKRFCAFIATAGIESDHLRVTSEYASGAAYEGRKDLGNVREGDGKRFKGHGIFQNTGRYNHWKVTIAYLRVLTGKNWDNPLAHTNFDAYLKSDEYTAMLAEADKYNCNFLANPKKLTEINTSVEAAGVFIADNKLNPYADRENFKGYSGIVNKGSPKKTAMAWNERNALYEKAMKLVPDDLDLPLSAPIPTIPFTPTPPQVDKTSSQIHESIKEKEEGDLIPPKGDPAQESGKEQIVIETKPRVKWWDAIKAKFGTVFGFNVGLEGVSSAAQQAQTFGLPNTFWTKLFWLALGASFILLIIWSVQWWKEDKDQTNTVKRLVDANSTDDNHVHEANTEDLKEWQAWGAVVIRQPETPKENKHWWQFWK